MLGHVDAVGDDGAAACHAAGIARIIALGDFLFHGDELPLLRNRAVAGPDLHIGAIVGESAVDIQIQAGLVDDIGIAVSRVLQHPLLCIAAVALILLDVRAGNIAAVDNVDVLPTVQCHEGVVTVLIFELKLLVAAAAISPQMGIGAVVRAHACNVEALGVVHRRSETIVAVRHAEGNMDRRRCRAGVVASGIVGIDVRGIAAGFALMVGGSDIERRGIAVEGGLVPDKVVLTVSVRPCGHLDSCYAGLVRDRAGHAEAVGRDFADPDVGDLRPLLILGDMDRACRSAAQIAAFVGRIDVREVVAGFIVVVGNPDIEGRSIAGDRRLMPNDIVLIILHRPRWHRDLCHTGGIGHGAGHAVALGGNLGDLNVADGRTVEVLLHAARNQRPFLRAATVGLPALNILTVGGLSVCQIKRKAVDCGDKGVGAVAVVLNAPLLVAVGRAIVPLLEIRAVRFAAAGYIDIAAAVQGADGVQTAAQTLDVPELVFAVGSRPNLNVRTAVLGHLRNVQHDILIQGACDRINAVGNLTGDGCTPHNGRNRNRRHRNGRAVSCRVICIDMRDVLARFVLMVGSLDIERCGIAVEGGLVPDKIVLAVLHRPGGHLDSCYAGLVRDRAGHTVAAGGNLSDPDIGDLRSLGVLGNVDFARRGAAFVALGVRSIDMREIFSGFVVVIGDIDIEGSSRAGNRCLVPDEVILSVLQRPCGHLDFRHTGGIRDRAGHTVALGGNLGDADVADDGRGEVCLHIAAVQHPPLRAATVGLPALSILTVGGLSVCQIKRKAVDCGDKGVGAVAVVLNAPLLVAVGRAIVPLLEIRAVRFAAAGYIDIAAAVQGADGVQTAAQTLDVPELVFAVGSRPNLNVRTAVLGRLRNVQHQIPVEGAGDGVNTVLQCSARGRPGENVRNRNRRQRNGRAVSCRVICINMGQIVAGFQIVVADADTEGRGVAGDGRRMPDKIVLAVLHRPGRHGDFRHADVVRNLAGDGVAEPGDVADLDVVDGRRGGIRNDVDARAGIVQQSISAGADIDAIDINGLIPALGGVDHCVKAVRAARAGIGRRDVGAFQIGLDHMTLGVAVARGTADVDMNVQRGRGRIRIQCPAFDMDPADAVAGHAVQPAGRSVAGGGNVIARDIPVGGNICQNVRLRAVAGAEIAAGQRAAVAGVAPTRICAVDGVACVVRDKDCMGQPAAVHDKALGMRVQQSLDRAEAESSDGGFTDADRVNAIARLGERIVPTHAVGVGPCAAVGQIIFRDARPVIVAAEIGSCPAHHRIGSAGAAYIGNLPQIQ